MDRADALEAGFQWRYVPGKGEEHVAKSTSRRDRVRNVDTVNERVSRRQLLRCLAAAGACLGADGGCLMYEDDGVTFDYQKGEFMRLRVDCNDPARRLVIALEPGSKVLPPLQRKIDIQIATEALTRSVVFTGEPIHVTF